MSWRQDTQTKLVTFHMHTLQTDACKHDTQTLSVMIPESKAFESVNKTALTRRAAIRLHASETVVPSGIVRAFDNLSFFTVLSPSSKLNNFIKKEN